MSDKPSEPFGPHHGDRDAWSAELAEASRRLVRAEKMLTNVERACLAASGRIIKAKRMLAAIDGRRVLREPSGPLVCDGHVIAWGDQAVRLVATPATSID